MALQTAPTTVDTAGILAHFTSVAAQWTAALCDLVRLETPSGDGARIRRFMRRYRGLLEAAGVACREIDGPAGPHLLGEQPGSDPAIVLVGHADTVWPAGEALRRPPRQQRGRLYGPGVLDMKAGLCLIAAACTFLRSRSAPLRRRLQVFISADEESGGATSHPHMTAHLASGAAALVPEPPCVDGSLKIRRKGVGIFRLEVIGREAHAGVAPARGVNAITEIARLVLEVESWNEPARGILVNVGEVGGGTATNVVAGRAWCGIDVRYDGEAVGEEFARRLGALRARHGEAKLSVSGGLIFPPLVPTPASERLAGIAQSLGASVGLEIGLGSSGGGSDGAFLAARGLTVLDGLGLDGDGGHSIDEHVVVDRLPQRAALLTALVLEIDRAGAASSAGETESA